MPTFLSIKRCQQTKIQKVVNLEQSSSKKLAHICTNIGLSCYHMMNMEGYGISGWKENLMFLFRDWSCSLNPGRIHNAFFQPRESDPKIGWPRTDLVTLCVGNEQVQRRHVTRWIIWTHELTLQKLWPWCCWCCIWKLRWRGRCWSYQSFKIACSNYICTNFY